MYVKILNQFDEFLDKQDMLNKLTESKKLNAYGYSEIHTIRAISTLEHPNITEIAHQLKMTKGAISKITKKLISKELIESYALETNKQKVFFKLTDKGKMLNNEHEKRHELWEIRDLNFLKQYTTEQLMYISLFMTQYNNYLQAQIKELGGD